MYLLTIREGLATRHIGPYQSPKQAADDLERQLSRCSERARWQIHVLEDPALASRVVQEGSLRRSATAA